MRRKDKKFWLSLIEGDDKKIRKIEKARERKDTKFFEDYFSKKRIKDNWL